ncbi:dephospho-CoA kinase [Chelativorans composti]|uniref:Dephospho-CoA kinase n=1 Tax=Chelativorans composti TaxID=768533 RepID=A0ABW5DJ16_9HYPH|nr:dephospho-CoA kinase [bacterium SGD-2]
MIILGLTGSIGMGKTTTARLFMDEGVPVHDADAAVHRLYAGEAAPLVEELFPGTVEHGVVNREKLAQRVVGNPEAMKKLETVIHPLVRADCERFLEEHRQKGTPVVVLDIPLLFETGGRERVNKVVVVSAPADVQKERVLARPGMTEEKLEAIRARQMPDEEKRQRADFVIETGYGIEPARQAVREILRQLRGA